MRNRVVAGISALLLLQPQCGFAWSNRGHRLINLAAAETLPKDMPAFMRTPQAAAQISYLGPEPDRWRPETAPELNRAAGPDHIFRYEAGAAASPLPRQRYEYLKRLEILRQQHPELAAQLTAQFTGTMPWQVQEIYQRLVSTFVVYRIVSGDVPAERGADMEPLSKADLPYIEHTAIFYAGWLGHYVGDGCMPLHASINVSGWMEKSNPNGYTAKGSIHHNYEVATDQAIEDLKITPQEVERLMPPASAVSDPFADIFSYLRREGSFAEEVYKFEKRGALQGAGTDALSKFSEQRISEGAAMLRNLIYSAWLQSKLQRAPDLPPTVTLQPR